MAKKPKNPVVKKRKVKKGKKTKTISKRGKGGDISQIVNVYVSKATKQKRKIAPKKITQAIQPKMLYNSGQEFMLMSLNQQNRTLMDIINKQRIADITPNSDISSLDNLINVKKLGAEKKNQTIPQQDDKVNYGGIAPINPKYNMDTTSRQDVSKMLSSIAKGMDEIPQGDQIKKNIIAIGDELRPLPQELTGIRVRIAEIDELDEKNKLENEFYELRTQLQEQKRVDNSIKMTSYRDIPKKVNTLKSKVAEMRYTLNQSKRLTAE